MTVLRLRTMTLKSVIGFGAFPDYTVGEMIIMKKHKELIHMYYNLERINYNDEVKALLFITKEREIEKPGRDRVNNKRLIYNCISDLYASDIPTTETALMLRANKARKKSKSEANEKANRVLFSINKKTTKNALKLRNQGH